ncbi:hypothetical protein BKA70DRAFT_1440920 [Coprinopsis sp. MPI-PUGE-AT-0042]|nr:hypothetical protein BKA70DRAFT_1440920 [Coprinopsis sp. MPI-PUGE-AT-0042]
MFPFSSELTRLRPSNSTFSLPVPHPSSRPGFRAFGKPNQSCSGSKNSPSKENINPKVTTLESSLPVETKLLSALSTEAQVSPNQRKIQKLEDKVRRLESRLAKARRQETVNADRLTDLAAENLKARQELHEALEEVEEANARLQTVESERNQYYNWWINEVNFSQSLLDGPWQTLPDVSSYLPETQVSNGSHFHVSDTSY